MKAVTSDYLRKSVGHSQFLTRKKCGAFGIERFCFPLPMHGMLEFHCAKKKVIDLLSTDQKMNIPWKQYNVWVELMKQNAGHFLRTHQYLF
jgi:hypothetical protein